RGALPLVDDEPRRLEVQRQVVLPLVERGLEPAHAARNVARPDERAAEEELTLPARPGLERLLQLLLRGLGPALREEDPAHRQARLLVVGRELARPGRGRVRGVERPLAEEDRREPRVGLRVL